jgi:hypothetical protein
MRLVSLPFSGAEESCKSLMVNLAVGVLPSCSSKQRQQDWVASGGNRVTTGVAHHQEALYSDSAAGRVGTACSMGSRTRGILGNEAADEAAKAAARGIVSDT